MMRSAFSTLLALSLTCGSAAIAQNEAPALPTNPAVWANSGPISMEALEGKAAVLYFFEEDCPRCAERWPGILETAAKFQGQPVVVIGVNSGTPPRELAGYLRQNRINLPVIMDVDRSLEKASNVGEISLQNIYQARIITADGTMRSANAGDLEGSIQQALQGAKWNVDPTGMPAELQAAWAAVEFGTPAAGAQAIRRAQRAASGPAKDAADRLVAYVDSQIQASMTEAQSFETAGQNWDAYKVYAELQEKFRGYDLPEDLDEKIKTLADDEAIKTEVAAMKQLDAIKRRLATANPTSARAIVMQINRLIEQSPGTDAAEQAQQLLTNLGVTP